MTATDVGFNNLTMQIQRARKIYNTSGPKMSRFALAEAKAILEALDAHLAGMQEHIEAKQRAEKEFKI